MSYTVHETKSYPVPFDILFQSAVGAIGGLEGKIESQDEKNGKIEAKFDKKILGKVLGDRTQINVTIETTTPGESTIAVEVYPLDPVGRKLMFGARKGVTRTVVTWFFAHLEHRLPKGEGA